MYRTVSSTDLNTFDSAPLSRYHWKILFIAGMGFLADAYDLFVIGIVMVILHGLWHISPLQESLVDSTALLASSFGALLFGRLADMFGRKRIYGVEVLVLAAGAIACAFAPNILWLIGFRFILGIGVGGDYPLSATIMSECSGKSHRGRMVTLVFAMQAAGLILGPLFAAALLSTSIPKALVWRILVGVGALPALAVYHQRRKLSETPRYLHFQGMQEDECGKLSRIRSDPAQHSLSFWDGFHRLVSENKLVSRLVGTSAAWFLMDAAFYGNTVSSPLVLAAVGGHPSLLHRTLDQLLIFSVFALPGYIAAVLAMDRLGRKTIQSLGFGVMALTFALIALVPGIEHRTPLFLLFYGTNFFFTEFGPNATTFVYPSEIFPVRVRSTGHGIAAAMGKLGAFLGVFLFPYLLRWRGLPGAEGIAAIASVLGLVLTLALLPETKGKSLEELSSEPATPPEAALAGQRAS